MGRQQDQGCIPKARHSVHPTAQSQLEKGNQDTQVLAAGPQSISQGRASSHGHNWCEKSKCLGQDEGQHWGGNRGPGWGRMHPVPVSG